MKKITKPLEHEHALYYEPFIALVDEGKSVLDQLKINAKMMKEKVLALQEQQLVTPYAPGKWSIKDILMHLVDCERVFLYRAMRFARNDKSSLPFFDENEFAKQAHANSMPIKKILKEYKATRLASLAFYANQSAAVLKRMGMASNAYMSVRASAWVTCGHELHHWNIIQERYLGARL